ncbi:Lipopolysaccharide export LptBFGC system, permease protein LptF [Shimia gijangensis]|uniref:Lipopolysaccharide export LptBFGC system, permease protein LptF n=1 Tax=Shimia gijangensis TaxID=1470563 RepID=A0A1M6JSX5_9RHOB|nr:LptF/LptG family permease [Shimia gijangensis]SHJ49818.1 Lipopolysaccharide export LptBFGC system, permease protein LptF [Shimia gijangensis]
MNARVFTGIASRNIAATHLKSIAFVTFVLLTVAIAIDLAQTIEDIRTKAADENISLLPLMLEYLLYRSADILARLLPMACLAGSFIAELLRHQRMENVILGAAGAPPTLIFAALVGVGAVTGTLQATLEGWVRPAAVFAQVDLQIGTYAKRFRQGELGTQWILEGDRAIQARILRSDDPKLHDLRVFEGVGDVDLRRIISASRAEPAEADGQWTLFDVTVWQGSEGNTMFPTQYEQLSLPLALTKTHLQYFGILGFYLPNAPLHQIAAVKGAEQTPDAETAVMRRLVAWILPGVFAFLGASLAQAGHNGRFFAWWRLLSLGAFGYICLVSVKSFWALGEFGVLSPLAATTTPLIFAMLAGILIQLRLNGAPRRQKP